MSKFLGIKYQGIKITIIGLYTVECVLSEDAAVQ